MDGEDTIGLQFEDIAGLRRWENSMTAIKQEAARIVDAAPDPAKLSVTDIAAISKWVNGVTAMVEAGTPVLPSILKARIDFAECISGISM
jgi:hypothetical protein